MNEVKRLKSSKISPTPPPAPSSSYGEFEDAF